MLMAAIVFKNWFERMDLLVGMLRLNLQELLMLNAETFRGMFKDLDTNVVDNVVDKQEWEVRV